MSDGRRRVVLLVGLAVPAVGTLIADPLMGLVDTAVVGRLGAAELGGLGLAVAVLSAVSWVFNFLVYGTTSSVARALGSGDADAARRRVRAAVRAALVLGLSVGVVLWVTAPLLLGALGAVDALVGPGADYLRVRAIGVPFLLLTYVGHGAFRGASDTRTPLLVAVGSNVLNAVLTVLLAGPFGIVGVAAATVAAEALAVAAFVVLLPRAGVARHGLLRGGPGLVDELSGARGSELAEVRALLRVGRDLFLRTGGLTLGLLAVSAAAARIGVVTAAAHQVLFQIMLLGAFMLDGLAVAGQATVGTALGRGERDEAAALGRATALLGAAGGTLTAVLLLASATIVPRLLTDDAAVLAAVATAWWLLALGHVITGVVFALDGVMMGAEDYRYLRNTTVLAALVGGSAAQVVASTGGTLLGLWWCVQTLMLVRFVALVRRLRGTGWLGAPSAAGPISANASQARTQPWGRGRLDALERRGHVTEALVARVP
jgi:putative MATE family efflux protein